MVFVVNTNLNKPLWPLRSTRHESSAIRPPVMTLFHTSKSRASREMTGTTRLFSGFELFLVFRGPGIQISSILLVKKASDKQC